ncbi:SulP family inorganic anion transporter [Rhizobium sp. GN54]|uniref:SulP family inorganic anion transporter n=1 Tax=Rhizobium sp. GN54 TaxID=2898150 RepID=UPI001E2ADB92|nr:SulP family inorganic anion transporter [Rhizobium sp. GN54]MCD2184623.1 SulP family inorganic anion transporter [Rhizobium sp. GN54]
MIKWSSKPHWRHLVDVGTLRDDLVAAITGAAIVLPQAIAFASIAGLPPTYGLYSAMITPVVAALCGSSRIVVSGPTTAVSALVFVALAPTYVSGSSEWIGAALVLTLLVGAIQLAIGLARLGRFLTFVSSPVINGFSAGAAILIAMSQLGDVLDVALPHLGVPTAFLSQLVVALPAAAPGAIIVAGVTLSTALILRFYVPGLPGHLVALGIGGVVNWGFELGTRTVGAIPSILPTPSVPSISMTSLMALAQPALAIAIVGLMQSVTVARLYAHRRDETLDGNREIIGQGLSNLVGPFFSAYAGSGSLTRTAVNHEAGARTPMAAVFASFALIAILFLVAPLFSALPIPAMAAVIILVAWRQIGFAEFYRLARQSRRDAFTFFITFVAAIAVGLEFSVFAGVLLSLALFLNESINAELELTVPDQNRPNHSFHNVRHGGPECPQLLFGRLNGPLYFGVVDKLRQTLRRIERERPGQKNLVLKLTGIGQLDLAGAELLIEEGRRRRARGGRLHLTSRYAPLLDRMRQYGVVEALEDENIYSHRHDAIAAIVPNKLDADICAGCKARIFHECPPRSVRRDTDFL